jgi:dGTPase
VIEYDETHNLELATFAGAEAQAAALADDIAYNAHDIDDGLRAGLFDLEAIAGIDFLSSLSREIAERYPKLPKARAVHELVRRVITHCIEDSIAEGRRRLTAAAVTSAEAVRGLSEPVIAFSSSTAQFDRSIKSFLFQNMYRHPQIVRIRVAAAGVVADLFRAFFETPDLMRGEWAEAAGLLKPSEEARRARLVCDYIAGMTDRYALAEHARLFDVTPELR